MRSPYLDLNEGFRQIGEVMMISAGDADSLALAPTPMFEPCQTDLDRTEHDVDLGLAPPLEQESKWKFKVMVSMGGPRDSLSKNYANKGPEYYALGAELDNVIKQNFSSHDERMSAVKRACQGKSEEQVIAMASNLASRLSNIYDYDRNYGFREDFIVLRAEKDFQIDRVGTVNLGLESQIPLVDNFNETTVGITLRYIPGR